ncbi:iron donor protein CyaY [Pneumocystis murina B123]|uniref:ferroxidase n=1 Tax=Pneumocystis murina (strain B123) TaxID=1069680 RepID=M7PHB9_PNEMU|nr:iron donor protein CyaY [Pneumocystis murina B123]EMR09844.1 iron donor protein CyaY [Pneumocystis murina B123]
MKNYGTLFSIGSAGFLKRKSQFEYRFIHNIIFQNLHLIKFNYLKYNLQNVVLLKKNSNKLVNRILFVFFRKYSSDLTIRKYHQLADNTIERILYALEQMQQDYPEKTIEVEYSQGVLTLDLGHYGTYVLNKQPPNRQIWVSSPISGPKRYDWIPSNDEKDGKWIYLRDNGILEDMLKSELKKIIGDLKL